MLNENSHLSFLSAMMNWTLARPDGMISASLRYFVSHAGAWEREILVIGTRFVYNYKDYL